MLHVVGFAAILSMISQLPSSTPAPTEVFTLAGLGLVSTAMSETTSWDLAKMKWGPVAFQRRLRLNDSRYSIVEVGFRTLLDGDKDPERCMIGNCFQNRVGSWRKLWNSIWISECQRRQGK